MLVERDVLIRHFGGTPMTALELQTWAAQFAEQITPLLGDAGTLLQKAMARQESLLFELAQGVMLDVNNGTWPFVTSSSTVPGAIGSSLAVYHYDQVIGVAKAYVTRVGGGPFPTETPEKGKWLRERGAEYGATTGRPRRCGWLDLVALKYACRVAGITELFIAKLDVLSDLESIPVCTAYHRGDGTPAEPENFTARGLEGFQPIYETLPGWSQDLTGCRNWKDLPENVRTYLDMIARETGVPVTGAGVGPDREQIVWR